MLKRVLFGVWAGILGLCAWGVVLAGWAASEYYSGRKVYSWLEGDWLFWFGLVGAAACLYAALRALRRALRAAGPPNWDTIDAAPDGHTLGHTRPRPRRIMAGRSRAGRRH